MAKSKPPNPLLVLSEQMTRVLEQQGRVHEGHSPLTLGQLGRLANAAATDETILKAAAKPPFKERAIVALAKSLDSPVALIDDSDRLAASDELLLHVAERICDADVPAASPDKFAKKVVKSLQPQFAAALGRRIQANQFPPSLGLVAWKKKPAIHLRKFPLPKPDDERLAEQLVAALRSQRDLGPASYPTTLQRLSELTQASSALLAKAVKHPAFTNEVLVAMKGSESPVVLREDRDRLLTSPQLLEATLRSVLGAETQVATPAELAKKVSSPLKEAFESAVAEALATRSLPASVGWLRQKKKALLFFRDDVQPKLEVWPSCSATRQGVVEQLPYTNLFDAAFQRLDQAAGSHNFVSLVDLRRELAVSRQTFDQQLQQLRLAGRYTLKLAEGRQGLSPAEKEAGIVENGQLMLFVARKPA